MRFRFYKIGCALLAIFSIFTLVSCNSLPKLSTLQPMPEYPKDNGNWDTSVRCVIDSDSAGIPMQDIMNYFNNTGYTICAPPAGYLTREFRISVDKALIIEDYETISQVFRDGSATDGHIAVVVHDTKHLQKYGPFIAQARSTTQMVNIRKVPGGKELLKEIKKDPEEVTKVLDLLDKDPKKTTAF